MPLRKPMSRSLKAKKRRDSWEKDMLVEAGLYRSRSEAIRTAVRDIIIRDLGADFLSKIVNKILMDRRGDET